VIIWGSSNPKENGFFHYTMDVIFTTLIVLQWPFTQKLSTKKAKATSDYIVLLLKPSFELVKHHQD
jgi:hypothetical protein